MVSKNLISLVVPLLIGVISIGFTSCEDEDEEIPTKLNTSNPNPGNASGSASVVYNTQLINFTTYKNVSDVGSNKTKINLNEGNLLLEYEINKGDTGIINNYVGIHTRLNPIYPTPGKLILRSGSGHLLRIEINDTVAKRIKGTFNFSGSLLYQINDTTTARASAFATNGAFDLSY